MNKDTVEVALEVKRIREGEITSNLAKLGITVSTENYDKLTIEDLDEIYNDDGTYSLFQDLDLSSERILEILSVNRGYLSLIDNVSHDAIKLLSPLTTEEVESIAHKTITSEVPISLKRELISQSVNVLFNKGLYIENYCSDENVRIKDFPSYDFFEFFTNHFSDKDKLHLIKQDESLGARVKSPSPWLALNIVKEASEWHNVLYELFEDYFNRDDIINEVINDSESIFSYLIKDLSEDELDRILKYNKSFIFNCSSHLNRNISEKFWLKHLDSVPEGSVVWDIPLHIKKSAIKGMELGNSRDRFISQILRDDGASMTEEMFEWFFNQSFM